MDKENENLGGKKIPWHYSIFLAEMAIWLKQDKPRAVVHRILECNINISGQSASTNQSFSTLLPISKASTIKNNRKET